MSPALIVLVATALIVLSTGQAQAESREELLKQISELDFSESLEESRFVTFSTLEADLSEGQKLWLNGLEECAGRSMSANDIGFSIPDREFSPVEERCLGILDLEPGEVFLMYDINAVTNHYINTGFVPESAMDILSAQLDLSELVEFLSLTRGEQFRRYSHLINKQSGKFYESYNAPQWQIGCFRIERITNAHEVEQRIGRLIIGENDKHASEIWTITVWGESQGSVLLTYVLPTSD